MTDIPRPKRTHHRLAGFVATAAALVLGLTLSPAAPATAGGDYDRGDSYSSKHGRSVDVMTRNLYLGADLTPVILALASGNQTAIVTAATQTWAAVQATKPEERMAAIADEIVKYDPAVVGLQEVTRWTTYSSFPPTNTGTVQYDFLELLLKALADRGVVYHEVAGATAENFTSPPIPIATATGIGAVSLADRDVILARDDVKTWNAQTGQFTNVLTFPLPPEGAAGDLPVARGWGSVDARVGKAKFRFVNSHLEAFGIPGIPAEAIRVEQVKELLAAQAAIAKTYGKRPIVYVGDYNSDAPTGDAYRLLVSSVGADAWLKTHRRDPGYTCCFEADLRSGSLDSRIDLIVIDKWVKAVRSKVIGDERWEMTQSGLWPSDHAGVVARLIIGPQFGRHHHDKDHRYDRRR
jgi:endonuclease/exonuclease/phosphatase family metal-dependent hydrolase